MPFLSTENTTLLIVLIFVLLVLALILLPAASFIRLAELIRSNGSKVEAAHKEIQQVQTTLLNGQAHATSSSGPDDTLTTQAEVVSPSTASTETTK
jgi:hypothetical protein